MLRLTLALAALMAASLNAHAQAPAAPAAAAAGTTAASSPAGGAVSNAPSYSYSTGMRFSYYDNTLTETTNLGVHVAGSQQPDTPQGLWAVVSIDATPRSQASTAALRIASRYFLHAVAGGAVIAYANVAAGATTSTASAVSAASSGSISSSLLGNLQGGMGFVWRACHTFNKKSKVNCTLDVDYELNAVTSQAVKPIIGIYGGLTF